MMLKRFFFFATVSIIFISCKEKRPDIGVITNLTDDGAWCWFSDSRAIYTHGENPGVLTGWVKEDGTIETALIDNQGKIRTHVLADTLDVDDHANPAFVELNNKENMVFYTKHFDDFVRFHKSVKDTTKLFGLPTLFDPFDSLELKKFPLKRTTYAIPFVLKEEGGKLYCFGRWTGFKPNFMTSDDNGKTFSKSKVIITNYPFDGENRPYAKYYSDGKSKIHIAFTDGHPRNELKNSVYYAYYEKDAFWRVDGTKICSVEELPFEPKDASLVYSGEGVTGKSWVFDIVSDKTGNPVILYTRYPDDMHHIYHYTRYVGGNWIDTKICDSGNWFPQTKDSIVEPEPNYSGGMTINPNKVSQIYVSEKIDGVFQIVKYKLDDNGKLLGKKLITNDTLSRLDNVRPFVPRNIQKGDKPMVLWMQNEKYVHYTEYKTAIKYYIDED